MSSLILKNYEVCMGLEIHCQLSTKTKLFCGCPVDSKNVLPNKNTCPVCLGLPGSLPVLNKKAVSLAVKFAKAVSARINHHSVFSRKQYFYPDLPKGYQISQFDEPYCSEGTISLRGGKKIRIERAHMEEDAGKSIHGRLGSQIDLNRAGTPLIEIVTHPDFRHATEVIEYLKKVHQIVRFIGISDGNMEKGNFRCDVNISLRPLGQKELGTRTELKNINSFKFVEKAISVESLRHAEILSNGGTIIQQTRGFDPDTQTTFPMREKEDSHDYRYFPDPDLPPLVLDEKFLNSIEVNELPEIIEDKFKTMFKFSDDETDTIMQDPRFVDYVENTISLLKFCKTPRKVGSFFCSQLIPVFNMAKSLEHQLPSVALARMIDLEHKGTLSSKLQKKLLQLILDSNDFDIDGLVAKHGLIQVTDRTEINKIILNVVKQHPEQWAEFKAGKTKLKGFFVGKIMQTSGGKLSPALVQQSIDDLLND